MARSLRGAAGLFVLVASLALSASPHGHAADYAWNVLGGGSQAWQNNANWSPATGFPSTLSDLANLAVPLTAPVTIDLGTTPVVIGRLDIGSTSAAVLTDVTAGAGGLLQLRNTEDADFDNNNQTNGNDFLIWQRGLGTGTTNEEGDATRDGFVRSDDLRSWRELFGRGGGPVKIQSNGVAGVTNRISAPALSGAVISATEFASENIEIHGTRGLQLAGGLRIHGDGNTLNSFLPTGATVTIGSLATVEHADGTTARAFAINNSNAAGGRIELNSVSGPGALNLGSTGTNGEMSTIQLGGANASYSGITTQNRSHIILTNDQALGTNRFQQGNPSQRFTYHISSDNDARRIENPMSLVQWATFVGENSLEWAGLIAQGNSRGIVNLLPAGKQLTLSGKQYALTDDDLARTLVYDGTGTTVITGEVSGNRYTFEGNMENGSGTLLAAITKQGPGVLRYNGATTYAGNTTINGGQLIWSAFDENVQTPSIIVNFGSVGADLFRTSGIDDTLQTNFSFLAKVAPTSTGGLVISPSEANTTFDFTAALAGHVGMSLAGYPGGVNFTGTIVPPADNTYRLGGGGVLTLPNAQLTGARNLIVTNGGVVQLNGANTYSGRTTLVARYVATGVPQALVNGVANNAALTRMYAGTVLAVSNLQNGGAASSLGNSANVASNLVIQGSTLRYTGAGASTDRLFTVGTGGATIEASGTGAVSFTNTGSLAMDAPASRTGIKATTATITGLSSTADLVIGMGISGAGIPANATITNINSDTTITISAAATDSNTDPLTFTAAARTLTLGGTNTGANTLRPNIVNGAAATNLAKVDGGTWILTGANTYTGTTTVSGGTLLVNASHAGGGAYTVAAGGTLGGSGSIAANISVTGTLAPGAGAGPLTVTGNVTFNAGSTAKIEIGGATAGLFDELILSGVLAAGGTFDVDLTGGFVPSIGQSFDVFDFASATGTFALDLPALPAGRAWNTATLLTTGTLSVAAGAAAIPEPSSAVLVALGAAAAAMQRRRNNSNSRD